MDEYNFGSQIKKSQIEADQIEDAKEKMVDGEIEQMQLEA